MLNSEHLVWRKPDEGPKHTAETTGKGLWDNCECSWVNWPEPWEEGKQTSLQRHENSPVQPDRALCATFVASNSRSLDWAAAAKGASASPSIPVEKQSFSCVLFFFNLTCFTLSFWGAKCRLIRHCLNLLAQERRICEKCFWMFLKCICSLNH